MPIVNYQSAAISHGTPVIVPDAGDGTASLAATYNSAVDVLRTAELLRVSKSAAASLGKSPAISTDR